MYQIKHIDTVSFGKIGSIVCGVVLFLTGVTMTVISAIVIKKIPSFNVELVSAAGVALALTTVLTACGVIMGFISGFLIALIYNHLSRLVGGLRLEINYINKQQEQKELTDEKQTIAAEQEKK